MRYIATSIGLGLIATPALAEPDLVLRNVIVVDVDEGTHRPTQNIAIEGGRITSVGPAMPNIGPKTQIIEAGGRYLIAGLWDAHVHSVSNWNWHAPAFLAHGVTSVRNLHTTEPDGIAVIEAIKAQGERGEAPRMIANGFIIDGSGESWGEVIAAATPEQAVAAVDRLHAAGMDMIKVYDSLPPEAFRAVMRRANELGIPVDGHLAANIEIGEAAALGQRTVEHHMSMANGCTSAEDWERARAALTPPALDAPPFVVNIATIFRANDLAHDPALCAIAAATMAEAGTVSVPTLVNLMSMFDAPDLLTLQRSEAVVPVATLEQWRYRSEAPFLPALRAFRGDWTITARRYLDAERAGGVTLLAGTDVGNPTLIPGASLLTELELFVRFGMDEAEALRTATLAPAQTFGFDTLGRIAEGYEADLVLLDHDPLEEISHLRTVAGVVLAGRYHSRPALDAALAAALEKENSPQP